MPFSPADHAFLVEYAEQMRRVIRSDEEHIDAVCRTRDLWLNTKASGGKVVFIGNGGSAGIASHIATDAGKNAHIPATCFNDASLITCLANDYGWENWFAHAIRMNCGPKDSLVAISSSGRSQNILNGVAKARDIGMSVVTFSGMSPDNPLRQLGDVNFWADSRGYNVIEAAHQCWLMSVIDLIIGKIEYAAS